MLWPEKVQNLGKPRHPCTLYFKMAKAKKTEENQENASEKSEEKVKENSEKKTKSSKKSSSSDENKETPTLSAEDKKAKLAKLLEKAKKLEGTVEELKDIDIKSKVKIKEEDEGKKDMLVPIEDYLKASVHLGTRVITPDMRSYVYRRRADGLAVFNTALLDDKIREGANYLANFAPKEIILVCKREAGWKAVKKFAEILGVKIFTKKYPAGILTNTNLDDFLEADLIFICDPWLDKNALADAIRARIPVLSICDTNNYTKGINQIVPGNNKSAKSLGMIFYLLAKLYSEKRKIDIQIPPISEFIDDWDNLVPPK
jgi:small subunit ribosomal protein S2